MIEDKEYTITDRQIATLRETISRVMRQIKLIKRGNTHYNDEDRMDIATECCKEVDKILCNL
jgi:hypothetical protein